MQPNRELPRPRKSSLASSETNTAILISLPDRCAVVDSGRFAGVFSLSSRLLYSLSFDGAGLSWRNVHTYILKKVSPYGRTVKLNQIFFHYFMERNRGWGMEYDDFLY